MIQHKLADQNKKKRKTIAKTLAAMLVIPLMLQSTYAQCIEGKTATKPLGVTKSLNKIVKLKNFDGNYKLLYFWNSDYQNNINLLSELVELQSAIDQSQVNMKVIAINSDGTKAGSRMNLFSDAKGWAAQYDDSNVEFTFDKKQKAKKAYCVSEFPTLITLDENNALIGNYAGELRTRKVLDNLTATFNGKS